MTLNVEDLLDDVKAYRNTMVARNLPFQEVTNLIMKWDQKILEETPEYKLKMFQEREQEERENLERISREAREEEKYLAHEQALADWAESFKEKDEN